MRPNDLPVSNPPSASLSPGCRLGRYEIVAFIGCGGMGQVYRARDAKLGRDVAIKVMESVLPESDSWNRFQREARAASALSHPNICTIYDAGESDGGPFLVMELLEGVTLRDFIGAKPLDTTTALVFGAQIAHALEAAHEMGIVHRDVKTANIMIVGRRHLKVLDFGLAKHTTRENIHEGLTRESLTLDGTVMGTLHYLPPEVLKGAPADARSDLWALGVVLYEMLTGGLPFTGPTAFETSSAILREPAPSLPATVPSAVRTVVERCLAKSPEERYQRAAEVRKSLEARISSTPHLRVSLGTRRWLWASAAAAGLAGGILLWQWAAESPVPSLSTGGPASANREANELFELAMQFQGVQGNVLRGQELLERALDLDPRFAEALRYHATAYAVHILNGQTNDASLLYRAEQELRQASEIAPDLPGLPAAFATVYLTQGRKDLIPWEELDRALREDPAHVNNRFWRGIALWLAGDYVAAKEDFRTALEHRPLFAPARFYLGTTLREEGDVQGGIREFVKVLEQAPDNTSAMWWLTLAYLDGGELEEARNLLESRRGMHARNYLWRQAWALLLAMEGNRQEAMEAMDEDTLRFAAAAFPSTLGVAEFYAVMGDDTKAIDWVERAVRNGDERTEWFRKSPRLANLQEDPRFLHIIESVESRRKRPTR